LTLLLEVRKLTHTGIAPERVGQILQPKYPWPTVGCRASTVIQRYQAVERVILSVRERLSEPLTLQMLADIAMLSPYHFNRVFRQITGIPPGQFLAALRVEAAKRMLLTTDLSVTDVCFDVGYNSLGTFTTHFRLLVGLPPSGLRRLRDGDALLPLDFLPMPASDVRQLGPARPSILGGINLPDAFAGLLFIGFFHTPIPQGRPVGCMAVTGPGAYDIAPMADGCYHVFAAAFAQTNQPLLYLLPDHNNVRVGVGRNPVQVRDGQVSERVDITLRPQRLTDPPILSALPFLLTEYATSDSAPAEQLAEREVSA
jgi:AraC family transcriptional regulator